MSRSRRHTAAEDKLDLLQQECRSRGLPVTVQRRTVLDALVQQPGHPTVDELFAIVRKRLPGISRTTIYRILETLVEMGIANKALHAGSTVRYDARTEDHDHFYCDGCGRVFDLEDLGIPRPEVPEASADDDVEVNFISVYLRGLCPDCIDHE